MKFKMEDNIINTLHFCCAEMQDLVLKSDAIIVETFSSEKVDVYIHGYDHQDVYLKYCPCCGAKITLL